MALPLRPLLGAALLVVSAAAAGCGGHDVAAAAGQEPVPYVALGDSYTAAPGLPPADGSDTDGCQRSLGNYPRLLTQQDSAIRLTDVSCSGATTADLLSKQDASLSADTKLVTVSIGGNDEGLFVTVIGGCTLLAGSDPTGTPCTTAGRARAQAALTAIRTNIDGVLADVARRAPAARVIVVGYPQVLPSDGSTCPDLVPIAAGDYAFVNSVNAGLSKDLEASAAAHGADFVDVYGASAGHDICSKDPWVNGQHTASDGVIPYHPFGAEQRAVAGLVRSTLGG